MTNITSRLMVKMCEYIANWVYKPTFEAKSNRSLAHPLPLKNEWRDSFHLGCWRGIYCGGMFKSTWKLIIGGQHKFIFPMKIRKKEVRYLSGWWVQPLWKTLVSWDVLNHQPVMDEIKLDFPKFYLSLFQLPRVGCSSQYDFNHPRWCRI